MYNIIFHKRVIKFISNRPIKDKKRIKEKLDLLKINPYPINKQADIKKLSNLSSYRLRVGDYRFIYEICDNELIIYMEKADNRGDIY